MTIQSTMTKLTRLSTLSTIVFFVVTASLFPSPTASLDTLSRNQSFELSKTLVSPGGDFELGLFQPGSSSGWYLGIWYRKIRVKTYVWVANRNTPLSNSTSTLKFVPDGNIALLDRFGKVNWKSNHTNNNDSDSRSLRLLNSGNLVVVDEETEEFLWQSFDEPTDTLLPGMRLGWDGLTEGTPKNRFLSSWRSASDPGFGEFSFVLDHRGFPEVFLWNRNVVEYRSGPWNGRRFSGVPEMAPISGITFRFVTSPDEVYYSFSISGNGTVVSRLTVSPSGNLERFTWMEERGEWNRFWYAPKDQCDGYRECGAFGICDANASPVCQCPRGFGPARPAAWALRDGSGGCVRKTSLKCGVGGKDGFVEMREMKLPESSGAVVDRNATIEECRKRCLEDCNCTAYAGADINGGGSGCVMWRVELLDLRNYAKGGQILYVRLAASDLENDWPTNRIIIIIAAVLGSIILLLGLCILWKRKAVRKMWYKKKPTRGLREKSQDLHLNEVTISRREFSGEKERDELDLPLFDYDTLAIATNNFSEEYKLGQGGFGCVYKGELDEGQEIAVKRLSKSSCQGIDEFKNEVRLIARLQHINLVRLLGCCIEVDEKILVYEFMENRSLDSILFSKVRGSLLDWEKRFNIICGIARGLLYLHQDSRFRIIHRDLKASNVLLDEEMTPKISDFGMARIFGRDQTEANTRRVVGTYGYMAPEYAMDGLFSVKSDAFSFGVLVLEIISGKKNRGFYYQNNELNLLGHAWNLWKKGTGLEIVDPSVGESYSASEVLRCMQVGLLCVQERAEDRPSMSRVLLMLSSETATMPQPKNPGFCLRRSPGETESFSRPEDISCTVNEVTVTVIAGR